MRRGGSGRKKERKEQLSENNNNNDDEKGETVKGKKSVAIVECRPVNQSRFVPR
jgi:hypothetical protein